MIILELAGFLYLAGNVGFFVYFLAMPAVRYARAKRHWIESHPELPLSWRPIRSAQQ
jgi:hypothetical protein